MMESIFTKIIHGQIPCFFIAETENCYAFLDVSPIAKAHTLVIPKMQIDNIFDLDDVLLSELICLAKCIGKAIEKTVSCKKVGISVIGLEVPHAHIHLVPINQLHDLDFKKERLQFTPDEYNEIARAIRANIN